MSSRVRRFIGFSEGVGKLQSPYGLLPFPHSLGAGIAPRPGSKILTRVGDFSTVKAGDFSVVITTLFCTHELCMLLQQMGGSENAVPISIV